MNLKEAKTNGRLFVNMLRSERCENRVDLVKSFPTSICLQTWASIQPRTSLSKFGGDSIHFFIRLLKGQGRHRRDDHRAPPGEEGRDQAQGLLHRGPQPQLKGSISNHTLIFQPNNQTL